MGLKFDYDEPGEQAQAAPETVQESNQQLEGQAQSKQEQAAPPAENGDAGETYFMQGAAADEQIAKAEAMSQAARDAAGDSWRFFCPPGEERRVTFIDGDLRPDGRLNLTVWWEHRIPHMGKWLEIMCMRMTHSDQNAPCIVCDGSANDYKPQLVCGLTVINHTPHTVVSGANQGKIIEDRKQVFVAPKTLIGKLQSIASKEGGLKFKSFDISRVNKLDARTGDQFYKVGTHTYEQLVEAFDEEMLAPTDWSKVVKPITEEQASQVNLTPMQQTGQGSASKPF